MSEAHSAYLQSNVLSSDPLTLVCIVYDAALRSVEKARESLHRGDALERTKAISKASNAVGMLTTSLRLDDSGEMGRNLMDLYLYMQRRLLDANLKQNDAALAEVETLLRTLREAWAELAYGEAAAPQAGPDHLPSEAELSLVRA